METYSFIIVQPAKINNEGTIDVEAETREDAIRILKEAVENEDFDTLDETFDWRFNFETYEDDGEIEIYDYEDGTRINLD